MEAQRVPGVEQADEAAVAALARQLRADSIRSSTAAGSGHPTSSLSAADLMAALLAWHLNYYWERPDEAGNDHLIFSKGHASPLLYAMFKAAGVITDEEMVTRYRQIGSRLQGHPTPVLPWVDVATGSLGQGLPDAVGVALAGRYLDRLDYKVWVLCGDSEMAEGSMWEALDKAGHYGLSNLTAIVDVNRLGQTGPTAFEWDLDVYARRVEAFGCSTRIIDGHDLKQIDEAFRWAKEPRDRPSVVLARTVKGKGITALEDVNGWHGKALPAADAEAAVQELGGESGVVLRQAARPARPLGGGEAAEAARPAIELPRYELGARVATRAAYGDALAAIGADPSIVVLDGEVGNSTYTDKFGKAWPDRFFQMYISEQQMIGAAMGLSVRGYRPFAASFAAFLTRAYDFVRMAAVSQSDISICGSHAGVEIGADGPSQMGLEDLAAFRALTGSTVLYPSDANSTVELMRQMPDFPGIVYLRTTRGAYPVIYKPGESFPVGGFKIVRRPSPQLDPTDLGDVLLIGAGVTVHNSLAAADELARDGVNASVIDLYSLKPLDAGPLLTAALAAGARLVITEDHRPEGGLGEAVMAALAPSGQAFHIRHLAVRELPGSGSPAELMAAAGIDAGAIVTAALELVEDD